MSVEEELQSAADELEKVEERRKRFLLGIPDLEEFSGVLEDEASNILAVIERLKEHRESTDNQYLEKINVLETITLAIEAAEQSIKAVNGFSTQIVSLLTQTNLDIYALIKRMDAEMEQQAIIREKETKTLENINDYIRKYG